MSLFFLLKHSVQSFII